MASKLIRSDAKPASNTTVDITSAVPANKQRIGTVKVANNGSGPAEFTISIHDGTNAHPIYITDVEGKESYEFTQVVVLEGEKLQATSDTGDVYFDFHGEETDKPS